MTTKELRLPQQKGAVFAAPALGGGGVCELFAAAGLDGADGVAGLPELEEGVADAAQDERPENDKNRRAVTLHEEVPDDQDLLAVADAKRDGDGMADQAAGGEGDHEGAEGHFEGAGGKDEGAERHGWREQGGEGDGEDGVRLHPAADALEDAGWGAFFDKAHAAGLADLVAEITAEGGAAGRGEEQEPDVGVLGSVEDAHDVGDAGDGQGDEGGIDDRDEEETEEAEGEENAKDVVLGGLRGEAEQQQGGRAEDGGAGEHGG